MSVFSVQRASGKRAEVACALRQEISHCTTIHSTATVNASRSQLFDLFRRPGCWADFNLFSFQASYKVEQLREGSTACELAGAPYVLPVAYNWTCSRAEPDRGVLELVAVDSDAGDCCRTYTIEDGPEAGLSRVRIVTSYTAASPLYEVLLHIDALFFSAMLPAALAGRRGAVSFAKSALTWTLLCGAFRLGGLVGHLVAHLQGGEGA